MDKQKINNVCNCKCHELGKDKCVKCKFIHISSEKAATHPNDKSNPDN